MMPSVTCRVSAALRERLTSTSGDHPLDIVVELTKTESGQNPTSRKEAIEAAKADFARRAEPIERRVLELGGEIIGRTWLGQSLLVRIAARNTVALRSIKDVEVLDVPSTVVPQAD